MINDAAADAQAGIAGESRAFLDSIILGCQLQSVLAYLNQIIDFGRGVNTAMHMPCDLTHQLHMAGDQLLDIGFLVKILVSH